MTISPVKTSKTKVAKKSPNPVDRESIKGFPAKAEAQRRGDKIYVYFSYTYSVEGKRYDERDHLGTVVNNEFVPNDYYLRLKPVKEKRPLENWKNETKRKREKERLNLNKKSAVVPSNKEAAKLDELPDFPRELCVGSTALMLKCLEEDGMIQDVGVTLNGNVTNTVNCINLGVLYAVTNQATYLGADESNLQKFIGWKGCLTSQRASELHCEIGSDSELPVRMGKRRVRHLEPGHLLALDGTRVNCQSDNISQAAIGKDKKGGFSSQINFSMLFNTTIGSTICYRSYSGNTHDSNTLEDFRRICTDFNLASTGAMILADRGYYSAEELIELDEAGFKYLLGAKTNLSWAKDLMANGDECFYRADHYLRNNRVYAKGMTATISAGAKSMDINAMLFRSPLREMDETDNFLDELDKYERKFRTGKDKISPAYARFYYDNKKKEPLIRNQKAIDDHCYGLGYFALVSNVVSMPQEALNCYSYRNDVEVYFRQQTKVMPSTRVHSDQTLNGQLFTMFIGASALTNLMYRMRQPNQNGEELRAKFTVPELVKKLQHIRLRQYPNGDVSLIDVSTSDKQIVSDLGFPGLFDDAKKVAQLMSAQHIAELIEKKAA